MGVPRAADVYQMLQTYFVLAVVFLLTALAFIPIGQVCGALMERREKLSAYGYNLLGSLAGVLLMFAVSAFWTPPSLWFLVGLGGLLLFCVRKRSTFVWAGGSVVLALILLEWPVDPAWQKIYSPYQLLEVGRDSHGLLLIQAAGHYYQHVHDFHGQPPKSREIRTRSGHGRITNFLTKSSAGPKRLLLLGLAQAMTFPPPCTRVPLP